jgi:hypothetical protein
MAEAFRVESSFPREFAANPIGRQSSAVWAQRPDRGVEPRSYHISARKSENGQRCCQFDKVKQTRMPYRSGALRHHGLLNDLRSLARIEKRTESGAAYGSAQ